MCISKVKQLLQIIKDSQREIKITNLSNSRLKYQFDSTLFFPIIMAFIRSSNITSETGK